MTESANGATEAQRWQGGWHLGVDYYPSQWPEEMWDEDVRRMKELGLYYVRINEFDWSLIEPKEGHYVWDVLDKSVEVLGKYGLKAIIGTPTATPPHWAVKKYDILPVSVEGKQLAFGSRRHYSFSSPDYRKLSQSITRALAQRYGKNPHVGGWQLDNEFGCHDTIRSYDKHATKRFQGWLQKKYGSDIQHYNESQGRVFWSGQYDSFDEIQPPSLEAAFSNPAHRLEWYDFSSDMTIEFAKEQTDILREYAPTQFVTHNFMIFMTDIDIFKFNRQVKMDIVTFDSYPTEHAVWSDPKQGLLRTGWSDIQALHHALYRSVSGIAREELAGPAGVMEQQCGPVSWSMNNVEPAPGMVRLWTHENLAGSGSLVTYFRWRQVPYAAEQMLTALLRPDSGEAPGVGEVRQVSQEVETILRSLGADGTADIPTEPQADVAIVYDYKSAWAWEMEPNGGAWNRLTTRYDGAAVNNRDIFHAYYIALRRLGLSIDVIGPCHKLDGYKLVVVPSMVLLDKEFENNLAAFHNPIVFGPHVGSKVWPFSIPPGLAPSAGPVRDRLPFIVKLVETPPAHAGVTISFQGKSYDTLAWTEWIEPSREGKSCEVTSTYATGTNRPGSAATVTNQGAHYISALTGPDFLVDYIGSVASDAGLMTLTGGAIKQGETIFDLGPNVRFTRRGKLLWGFNYGHDEVAVPPLSKGASLIVGDRSKSIAAHGVSVWKLS